MSDKISWYTIPKENQNNNNVIIATVGIVANEIACIAYHFDYSDRDFNGKVSLTEKMSGLFLDNHRNVNLYIAKWLSTNVAEFDKGTYFVNDMNLFLSKASAIKACNVNLSHFQDVTGLCVDFRGNGVIGSNHPPAKPEAFKL